LLAKPKKVSRTALKKKCDILASRYYRAATPYCELAGLDGIRCGGPLQWCHITSRSVVHLRYERYNNLILCAGHHSFYTRQPLDWIRTLEEHFPEKLALVEQQRYKFSKIDYEAWIDMFRRGLEAQTDHSFTL
jgi:hypothetical protein